MTTAQHPLTPPLFPFTGLSVFRRRVTNRVSANESHSSIRRPSNDSDEDWYIPYNGPYEAPPRRSWSIDGGSEMGDPFAAYSTNRYEIKPRLRASSAVSHASSRVTAGHRKSQATTRTRPSFINLDAAGGIGQSPVAPLHPTPPPPRTPNGAVRNIAGFFGGSRRRSRTSPATASSPTLRPSTSISNAYGGVKGAEKDGKESRSTALSDDNNYRSWYSPLFGPSQSSRGNEPLSRVVQQDADPLTPQASQYLSSRQREKQPEGQGEQRHPYAYVFPSDALIPPNSAGPHSAGPHRPPPLQTRLQPIPGSPAGLKPSSSTPNLRPSPISRDVFAKDRWLSPETWCDALIFPRPRLKLKQAEMILTGGGSGRIVSPPTSFLLPAGNLVGATGLGMFDVSEDGRVALFRDHSLKKARSTADLVLASPSVDPFVDPTSSRVAAPGATQEQGRTSPHVQISTPINDKVPSGSRAGGGETGGQKQRPPRLPKPLRPKSFAQDDLALPSPVPSLQRVLDEGNALLEQREAWRRQAMRSFQNKRTRSASRSHQGYKRKEDDTMLDFLTTRACLGSQSLPVHVEPPTPADPEARFRSEVRSGTSHSHSRSHSYTYSHSRTHSQSNSNESSQHRRGHARNESWGRSAMKFAKTTTAGFCGLTETEKALLSPAEVDARTIERYMGPEKPALVPSPVGSNRSGTDGVAMGIALSTPSLSEQSHTKESYNPADFLMHDHPYAHGASQPGKADFAGPHPVTPHVPGAPASISDGAMRHRLPPQAGRRMQHPYSHQHSPPHKTAELDDNERFLRPRARADSDVPPPKKMFVEVEPGDVREILPDEIQYSPFLVKDGVQEKDQSYASPSYTAHAYASAGQNKHRQTTLGLDDALTYTLHRRTSQDSGLGTSEDHNLGPVVLEQRAEKQQKVVAGGKPSASVSQGSSQVTGSSRVRRKPVVYDSNDLPLLDQPSPEGASSSGPQTSSLMLPLSPPDAPVESSPRGNQGSPSWLKPYMERGYTSGSGSSSNVMHSDSSSPQPSPRQFGVSNSDDMERFRDLFFKPQSPIAEGRSSEDSGEPDSALALTAYPDFGLASLARQLPHLDAALSDDTASQDATVGTASRTSIISDRHFRSTRSRRQTYASTAPSIPSQSMDSRAHSPVPLHLPTEQGNFSTIHPSIVIPEDVSSSSRASSILEVSSPVEDDTFGAGTGILRVGAVEAVHTPTATSGHNRKSSHLSLYGVDALHVASGHRASMQDEASPGTHSHNSLQPRPVAGSDIRSSYMTSDTGTSRISGLSDFPAPPHVSSAQMSLIKSYFADVEGMAEGDAHAGAARASSAPGEATPADGRRSRRMTFGGDEDSETAVRLHP